MFGLLFVSCIFIQIWIFDGPSIRAWSQEKTHSREILAIVYVSLCYLWAYSLQFLLLRVRFSPPWTLYPFFMEEFQMNLGRIVFIVGVLIAIVGGLGVAIPYAALALVVLGVVSGWTDDSDKITILLTALALSSVHGALDVVPTVGGHITGILGGVSSLISAAALAVIVKGVVARVMP